MLRMWRDEALAIDFPDAIQPRMMALINGSEGFESWRWLA